MNIQRYVLDIGERTAATFAEAFLAFLGANLSGVMHVATWKGAAAAGGAAALAVVKGLVAGKVGDEGNAALLPAAAGGAAGAAVGGAVGTAVGDVVGGAGQAVGDIVKDIENKGGTT